VPANRVPRKRRLPVEADRSSAERTRLLLALFGPLTSATADVSPPPGTAYIFSSDHRSFSNPQPDGQIAPVYRFCPVQSGLQKYSCFRAPQIRFRTPVVPSHSRGVGHRH
jgi:hypothetical protein